MNIKEKVFSTNIVFRCKPEEKERIVKFLCKKKKDKLGEKLRQFILDAIDEKEQGEKQVPDLEYILTHDEGITGVYLYSGDQMVGNEFYESEEDAIKYIKSMGARERKNNHDTVFE